MDDYSDYSMVYVMLKYHSSCTTHFVRLFIEETYAPQILPLYVSTYIYLDVQLYEPLSIGY